MLRVLRRRTANDSVKVGRTYIAHHDFSYAVMRPADKLEIASRVFGTNDEMNGHPASVA